MAGYGDVQYRGERGSEGSEGSEGGESRYAWKCDPIQSGVIERGVDMGKQLTHTT
jgi:hypothetical protein